MNGERLDNGEKLTSPIDRRRETIRTVIPEEQNEIERNFEAKTVTSTVIGPVRETIKERENKAEKHEERIVQEQHELLKLKLEQEQRSKKEQELKLKELQEQRLKAEQELKLKELQEQRLKIEQEQRLQLEQRKKEQELKLKELQEQRLKAEQEQQLEQRKKEHELRLKEEKEQKIKEEEQERLRKEKEQRIKAKLIIKEAVTSQAPDSETSVALEVPKIEDCLAEEKFEQDFVAESFVASSVEVQTSVVDEGSEVE